MSRPRCSRRIVLVLIGAAAAPACGPVAPRAVHDRYANLQDCSADWGRPEVCDRVEESSATGTTGYGVSRVFFRGPSYPEGDRTGAQSDARAQAIRLGSLDPSAAAGANHAIVQSVPTRGGFGASSHVFGRLG